MCRETRRRPMACRQARKQGGGSLPCSLTAASPPPPRNLSSRAPGRSLTRYEEKLDGVGLVTSKPLGPRLETFVNVERWTRRRPEGLEAGSMEMSRGPRPGSRPRFPGLASPSALFPPPRRVQHTGENWGETGGGRHPARIVLSGARNASRSGRLAYGNIVSPRHQATWRAIDEPARSACSTDKQLRLGNKKPQERRWAWKTPPRAIWPRLGVLVWE